MSPPSAPLPAAPAAVDALAWRPEDVERLLKSLIADELSALRGRPFGPAEWSGWTSSLRIDEEGLGVDSLDRLSLVGRVNAFFHLHEVGGEDYLVVRRTLGEWVEVVCASLALSGARLTFRTSGSTGAPKEVTHSAADLRAEVEALGALLGRTQRVLALAPPHHIYGFLFTVALPGLYGLPVLDLRLGSPSRARALAEAGDLVVATPFLWEQMLRLGGPPRGEVTGASASAPMPAELWRRLEAGGLARLVEVYGSTETGGVGWRDGPDQFFQLLPGWSLDVDGVLRRGEARFEPPDFLEPGEVGRFRPAGRRDAAVQVGGVNVFPERVRAVLLEQPGVADCAVRLDGAGASARLKALVVLSPGQAEQGAVERLEGFARERLSPPERPARYRLASALPRSEIGKAVDWD